MKDSLQLVSSCNCLQGCWGSQGDKGTGQGAKGIGGQVDKGGKWDKGTREANGLREQGRQMGLGNKGGKWYKGTRETNGIRGQGDRPGDQGNRGQVDKGGKWDKGTREANGIRGTRRQLTSLYGGFYYSLVNSLPL